MSCPKVVQCVPVRPLVPARAADSAHTSWAVQGNRRKSGCPDSPDCNTLSGMRQATHQNRLSHVLPTAHVEDPDLAMIVGVWDRLADECKQRLPRGRLLGAYPSLSRPSSWRWYPLQKLT